jgi:hypothetical protein
MYRSRAATQSQMSRPVSRTIYRTIRHQSASHPLSAAMAAINTLPSNPRELAAASHQGGTELARAIENWANTGCDRQLKWIPPNHLCDDHEPDARYACPSRAMDSAARCDLSLDAESPVDRCDACTRICSAKPTYSLEAATAAHRRSGSACHAAPRRLGTPLALQQRLLRAKAP